MPLYAGDTTLSLIMAAYPTRANADHAAAYIRTLQVIRNLPEARR